MQLPLPKMQTSKPVSQRAARAVKPNLLFTESQRTYILWDKNSLFYSLHFLAYYIQPQTTAFSSISSQKPWAVISETKQNKTKTHIKTPQTPLITLSAKFGGYFHVNLGLCTACGTIIFIWDLNILEELEPSFLLSCHFPPWKWRAYGRHPPWILEQQEGPDFNSYILSSVTLGIFCSCKAKDVIRICHTDGA